MAHQFGDQLLASGQRIVNSLTKRYPTLGMFTHNYSQTAMKQGQYLGVKTSGGSIQAKEYTGTFEDSDLTLNDKQLALAHHIYVRVPITEEERQKGMTQYEDVIITEMVNKISDYVFKKMFSKITTHGAGASIAKSVTIALNDFNRNKLVDIGTFCSENNVGVDGRFMITTPQYYGKLKQDSAFREYTSPSSGVVATGVLPVAESFKITDFNSIQNQAAPHNVRGIFGSADGIGIVAAPTIAPQFGNGTAKVVTDANGFPMGMRLFADEKAGVDYIYFGVLLGCEVVASDRVFAITSDDVSSTVPILA